MEKNIYRELSQNSRQMGETNDCGVLALAVITGAPYEHCHSILKSFGRKNRKGTFHSQMWRAFDVLGFEVKKISCPFPGMRSFERNMPKEGAFLIHSTRHYAGVKDGQVHDWSQGSCKRIVGVYQIFKKGEEQKIHEFKEPSKTRTRKTSALYHLIYNDRVVAEFRRFPTRVKKVIDTNGMIRCGAINDYGCNFELKSIK